MTDPRRHPRHDRGAAGDASCRALASPISGIELWLVDLDRAAADSPGYWLSAVERERADRFVFDRDARRYRAAHVALRRLLAGRFDVPPGLAFAVGEHGKPSLPSHRAGGFNLSRSGGSALIALGPDANIGADIERVLPIADFDCFAPEQCTEAERAELAEAPAAQALERFLVGWTRKEACLKSVGIGLNVEPREVEVGLQRVKRMVEVVDSGMPASVEVANVDAGPGLMAALAVRRF